MKKNILFYLLFLIAFPLFAQERVLPAFDFLSKYDNLRDFTISANQDEAYFTIQSPFEEMSAILVIKKIKDKWSKPELVNFTGQYRDIEPFLTVDGLKLYFCSNRPLNDSSPTAKDYDIWYVERKDLKSSWSAPINLGTPINTSNNEFYPSLAKNGNLYFTSDAATALKKDDIYFSVWNGSAYEVPVALDTNINTVGYEFNAYISANEDFIIYTGYNRKDGVGSGDLYVCYKDDAGNWTDSINMGTRINSKQMDYCPYLDAKGNSLYFTSKRNRFEPKSVKTLEEFETVSNQYENGLSRIYKVPFRSPGNKR